MGLAIATGLCWKMLAGSIPGFRPISGSNVLLIGGRDFDEGERERLEGAGVTVIDSDAITQTGVWDALQSTITNFQSLVEDTHLHIDLDALNAKETPANNYQYLTEGGMSVEQLRESIALIKRNLNITSATIASFDPRYDPQGKTLQVGLKLIQQILGRE
jgi:arginase